MAKPSSSSFSLPTQNWGWGGGSKQTSPTGPFPPPYTAGASCTGSKTGDSKVRWSFHTLSHKDQGIRKKKMVIFLTLALSTNMVPDLLTAVVRKANALP